jgi:hypothetical protein
MLLLRGIVGGSNARERRIAKDSLASLPDWNDDVRFEIYGKECRMRRRICQFSSGGGISYSYSGLVSGGMIIRVAPATPPRPRRLRCRTCGNLPYHAFMPFLNHGPRKLTLYIILPVICEHSTNRRI